MKALIFAAGLGTRLKPLTDRMPKALVPLGGKSLLQWQVEKLRDAGIEDIIVNVHHFPDMIIDAIRENKGWGAHIEVSDERECLLETGGGLKKIIKEKLIIKNEPVLACNADILSNIDIRALVERYEQTGVSQLVVSERETQRYLLFDANNILRGWTNVATGEVRPESLLSSSEQSERSLFFERSGLRLLAFSGMQILSPEVLRRLEDVQEDKFSLIDFYLHLCTNYQLSTLQAYVPKDYRMMDVGKIDQIEAAEAFAESMMQKK